MGAQHRSRSKTLSQFYFSDEGAKCKIYVDVGSELLERKEVVDGEHVCWESAVSAVFSGKTCVLQAMLPKSDGSIADRRAATFVFDSDVVPEKCSYKVDRQKGRITLTLKKRDE